MREVKFNINTNVLVADDCNGKIRRLIYQVNDDESGRTYHWLDERNGVIEADQGCYDTIDYALNDMALTSYCNSELLKFKFYESMDDYANGIGFIADVRFDEDKFLKDNILESVIFISYNE